MIHFGKILECKVGLFLFQSPFIFSIAVSLNPLPAGVTVAPGSLPGTEKYIGCYKKGARCFIATSERRLF